MKHSEVIEEAKSMQLEVKPSADYSVEDISKITNLFSILISIDKKVKAKGGVCCDEKRQPKSK